LLHYFHPQVVGAVIMAMQAARAGGAGIAKARAALLGIDFKNNKY
jgi:hypothetical protein